MLFRFQSTVRRSPRRSCSSSRYWRHSSSSSRAAPSSRLSRISTPEKIGHVLQAHSRRAWAPCARARAPALMLLKKEVRTDPRLQRLQASLHDRRGQRASAKSEVEQQDPARESAQASHRQDRRSRASRIEQETAEVATPRDGRTRREWRPAYGSRGKPRRGEPKDRPASGKGTARRRSWRCSTPRKAPGGDVAASDSSSAPR
jgi:hypothetical protein